jgi:hypothetical protein
VIINIFKNEDLYKELEKYNQDIIDIDNKIIANKGKDSKISYWFDPKHVRALPLSRTSPKPDPSVQDRAEYRLILYASNYMPLFLANLLYGDRKDIMIEDFGVGDGRFLYYLSKMGFNDFSAWDNWSQCDESMFRSMMEFGNIRFALNDPTTRPIMVNSSASPFVFITHGFDDRPLENQEYNRYQNRDISSVELVTFYTNRHWENILTPMFLPKRNFVFLCKDEGDLSVAYCRKDKYEEFHNKLEGCKIK